MIIGSAGLPIQKPVGLIKPPTTETTTLSKKKQEEIKRVANIKDRPDHQIDYFTQKPKYKDKDNNNNNNKQSKPGTVRSAAGKVWADPTLADWDPSDFRIFVGNIGYEIVDEHLQKAFSKYSSFQKAKVIRASRNNRSKGYGFVSLKDPDEYLAALKEMDGNS